MFSDEHSEFPEEDMRSQAEYIAFAVSCIPGKVTRVITPNSFPLVPTRLRASRRPLRARRCRSRVCRRAFSVRSMRLPAARPVVEDRTEMFPLSRAA
jgi:hypothetical protein